MLKFCKTLLQRGEKLTAIPEISGRVMSYGVPFRNDAMIRIDAGKFILQSLKIFRLLGWAT